MIHLEEQVTVRRNIHDVFRYVSHFSNIAQWDPGVIASRKITPGPIGEGSRFELQCTFLGVSFPMTYRITALNPPHRLVLEGRGETVVARDTIVFTKIETGTRITYSLDLEIKTGHFLTEQVLRFFVRRIGKNAVGGLARAFNAKRRLPEMRLLDRWMDKCILPGMLTFSKYGYLWRKKSWYPLTESLDGRTVLVTGATSGLGKVTALACARMGAKTIVAGRSAGKVDSVCGEIAAETGNPLIRGEVADLSIKSEIRSLVKRLDQAEPFIHVLINNAGALFDRRRETAEGIERSLAINLMGPFLLTTLLIPKLKASAPSRVINVSSGGMYTQRLVVDDLGFENEPYNGEKAYARAKRGLVVLSRIWAEKYKTDNLVFHAMHPGWVATPGIRKSLPRFYERTRSILRTPEQGADTIVWLAAAREVADTTGEFWFDRRPHIIDILPGTRSTQDEHGQLIKALHSISDIEVPE